jgi:hypothetical protein
MFSYLFLLCFITLLPITKCENFLFAGNGLITYGHTILHNRIIEINCTTYDDCYNLLCDYIDEPIFPVVLKPNTWTNACHELNLNDERLLLTETDVYYLNKNHKYYMTKTVSDLSILLCNLNKEPELYQIIYFGITCQE